MLHVLRYKREALPALIDALNATGYALTGGVHSRIDDDDRAGRGSRIAAGNVYVNRNIIGAVVGVQPFGGHGLSGTGPKAGGPLYLKRLLARAPAAWPPLPAGAPDAAAKAFAGARRQARRRGDLAALCERIVAREPARRQPRAARPGRRAQRLFARAARRRAVRRGRAKRR